MPRTQKRQAPAKGLSGVPNAATLMAGSFFLRRDMILQAFVPRVRRDPMAPNRANPHESSVGAPRFELGTSSPPGQRGVAVRRRSDLIGSVVPAWSGYRADTVDTRRLNPLEVCKPLAHALVVRILSKDSLQILTRHRLLALGEVVVRSLGEREVSDWRGS